MKSHDSLFLKIGIAGGFSLFECLIALLLLSIGLFGVASAELMLMTAQQNVYRRMQVNDEFQRLSEQLHININKTVKYAMMNTWQQQMLNMFPGGRFNFESSDDHCRVNIYWRDPRPQIVQNNVIAITENVFF